MTNVKLFNEYSKEYDKWFDKNKFVYLSELKAVRQFIPKSGKGLAVGVGSGRFAKPLGVKEGIDPSAEMRKIAKKRGLKVYDAVAENLPFQNESFKFILMITTICFLDDVNAAFEEVFRVLKSKGIFIIGFIDKNSLLGKRYLETKEENVFYKHATFYSTEEVIKLLEKHEFNNLEIIQTIFGELENIKLIQDFKQGYGEGGFIVIKAEKKF